MPQGIGTFDVQVVDGSRQPLDANQEILVQAMDGRRKIVKTVWGKGPAIVLTELPYYDSPDDLYTILVSASGFADAGITPVRLRKNVVTDVFLMLPPKNSFFHFAPIAQVLADDKLGPLIANGTDAANVATRYGNAMEETGPHLKLGALLAIATAVRDIPLLDGSSPLSNHYWEVRWDILMPDRFWAWVEVGLADRIADLAKTHALAAEPDPGNWHPAVPGICSAATRSWKQVRFDTTNVQLTFHENDKKRITVPGRGEVNCVLVEPDMDMYKDPISHGLLEVIPNLVTDGKTDPRAIYGLRWAATRQEGLGDFAPPCTLE